MKLEIKISQKPVEYQDAIELLEERVKKIQNKDQKRAAASSKQLPPSAASQRRGPQGRTQPQRRGRT